MALLGFSEFLSRLGILVKFLLLLLEHAHPLHEREGLPRLVDLRVFDLARGEPLVLLLSFSASSLTSLRRASGSGCF